MTRKDYVLAAEIVNGYYVRARMKAATNPVEANRGVLEATTIEAAFLEFFCGSPGRFDSSRFVAACREKK